MVKLTPVSVVHRIQYKAPGISQQHASIMREADERSRNVFQMSTECGKRLAHNASRASRAKYDWERKRMVKPLMAMTAKSDANSRSKLKLTEASHV